MASIKLKGNTVRTFSELPEVGTQAPDFKLTGKDLSEVELKNFAGKNIILNIFPSLDTSVCATSVRKFNQRASDLKNTAVLCISHDLPFAHYRFCAAEGIANVTTASVFRSPNFGKDYGVEMVDGPLSGLLSRAIVVIGSNGKVLYTEQVPEIGQEPDYESAIRSIH